MTVIAAFCFIEGLITSLLAFSKLCNAIVTYQSWASKCSCLVLRSWLSPKAPRQQQSQQEQQQQQLPTSQ
jgi:hypothetical protein